jgi:hypothetical protein
MITIENYNSDMKHGVFFGWDMEFAMEDKSFYSFEFVHRKDNNRVYVLLHRNETNGFKDFYEVYIADMKDRWKRTVQLDKVHLNKKKFYLWIESVIDEEYGLPF